MKRIASIGVLVALAATGMAAPEYSAVFMNDAKIGHSRLERTVQDDRVITAERTDLNLDRMGFTIQVQIDTRYVETADGKPLEFAHSMQMGPMGGMSKTGVITDGRMRVTASGMGIPQESTVVYPTEALMPEGVRLFTQQRRTAGAKEYTYVTFDPEGLQGRRTEVAIGKRTSVPLIGEVASLTALTVTMDANGQQIVSNAYMDDAGDVRKASMAMIGMRLDIVACDEAFALSPNERVDLLDGGSVTSPTKIARPRETRQATFTLVPTSRDIKLLLPDTQEQRVATNADGTTTVRVKLNEAAEGTRPYRGSDAEIAAMLKPTAYVQCEDSRLVAKARQIVGDTADALAAARKIEAWVRNHISNKTLTVGYASALATLTGRAGDCTEHAVLTAALCRASGIPCRVVVGIAYVEQFGKWQQRFIGHAWNQAYVGGKWVCLDASLVPDASRVALTLGAGDPLDFVGIIHSLGSFKITRVKTE